MTDAELDELEAKAKAATQGPWVLDYRSAYVFSKPDNVNVCEIRGYGELVHQLGEKCAEEQMEKNADYIVTANPTTILNMIAELRQTRAERDWLAVNIGWLEAQQGRQHVRRIKTLPDM